MADRTTVALFAAGLAMGLHFRDWVMIQVVLFCLAIEVILHLHLTGRPEPR